MEIRNSNLNDLERLEHIYVAAREIMRRSGNPNQWKDNAPHISLIIRDIKSSNHYVLCEKGEVYAAFSLIIGEEPTYKVIEGKWLNDEEYATIHRLASDGNKREILKECLSFCEKKISNIRIDTHEDNRIMKHLLEKYGFIKCGIIYLENGEERVAYQKIYE